MSGDSIAVDPSDRDDPEAYRVELLHSASSAELNLDREEGQNEVLVGEVVYGFSFPRGVSPEANPFAGRLIDMVAEVSLSGLERVQSGGIIFSLVDNGDAKKLTSRERADRILNGHSLDSGFRIDWTAPNFFDDRTREQATGTLIFVPADNRGHVAQLHIATSDENPLIDPQEFLAAVIQVETADTSPED